jgi:hypothetical protein
LIIGVSALTVVSLGLGGLLASGILDEEKARPVVERIVESAPVPVPQAPPPAAPKREPAPQAAAKKPAEPAAQPVPAAEPPAAAAPPAVAPAAEPPIEKPAKTEPRTRHPRTVAAASEATPTVRLAVVSDPPGAEVIARWDGGEKKGKAPFQFDAPKGAQVKLDFTLKGYSPSQEEVVADAPRTVSSELVQFLGD